MQNRQGHVAISFLEHICLPVKKINPSVNRAPGPGFWSQPAPHVHPTSTTQEAVGPRASCTWSLRRSRKGHVHTRGLQETDKALGGACPPGTGSSCAWALKSQGESSASGWGPTAAAGEDARHLHGRRTASAVRSLKTLFREIQSQLILI